MKFTDKYIKMCDTPEIQDYAQEPCNRKRGDYIASDTQLLIRTGHDTREREFTYLKHLGFNRGKNNLIFLPLQHQLQEMVLEKWENHLIDLIKEFNFFIGFHHEQFNNFNEFWLAYTMDTLYQKKWNNTKEVWE